MVVEFVHLSTFALRELVSQLFAQMVPFNQNISNLLVIPARQASHVKPV